VVFVNQNSLRPDLDKKRHHLQSVVFKSNHRTVFSCRTLIRLIWKIMVNLGYTCRLLPEFQNNLLSDLEEESHHLTERGFQTTPDSLFVYDSNWTNMEDHGQLQIYVPFVTRSSEQLMVRPQGTPPLDRAWFPKYSPDSLFVCNSDWSDMEDSDQPYMYMPFVTRSSKHQNSLRSYGQTSEERYHLAERRFQSTYPALCSCMTPIRLIWKIMFNLTCTCRLLPKVQYSLRSYELTVRPRRVTPPLERVSVLRRAQKCLSKSFYVYDWPYMLAR
jgi:hypothetical protein